MTLYYYPLGRKPKSCSNSTTIPYRHKASIFQGLLDGGGIELEGPDPKPGSSGVVRVNCKTAFPSGDMPMKDGHALTRSSSPTSTAK